MYLGRFVELADTTELYNRPRHPYTDALLRAVPKADPLFRDEDIALAGEVPDPSAPPAGCHFHPRCPYARERCSGEVPVLREIAPGHRAACHFTEELSLPGVGR